MRSVWIATLFVTIGLMADVDVSPQKAERDLLSRVDHLVYATPDLAAGIAAIERALGVRATPGGQHPGRGTRNALVSLGPTIYLEIIGPDPAQPKPARRRAHGLDDLEAARLATWAAKGDDLTQLFDDALRKGIKLGDVTSGSRRTPDAVLLAWRFTNSSTVVADGIVPFFINWGETPHPARTSSQGATLVSLRAEHPDADRVQNMLGALGLAMTVGQGSKPALIATIASPRGRVELR